MYITNKYKLPKMVIKVIHHRGSKATGKVRKMSKNVLKINGKSVKIDTNKPKVADLLAQLFKALTTREFQIGMVLEHENQDSYLLSRIKQCSGAYRAYLINMDTGIARNSTKRVMVEEPKNGRGYVTDLPCKKDRFYDPEDEGSFIEVDENGKVA